MTHYGQVGVVGGFAQPQFLLLVRGHALQHAVEDVVVPLIEGLQREREGTSQVTAAQRPADKSCTYISMKKVVYFVRICSLNATQ